MTASAILTTTVASVVELDTGRPAERVCVMCVCGYVCVCVCCVLCVCACLCVPVRVGLPLHPGVSPGRGGHSLLELLDGDLPGVCVVMGVCSW